MEIPKRKREEAERLQGARKLGKDKEMAWAPPRNKINWLDWEEASKGRNNASLSCRMRWKALTLTMMAKAIAKQAEAKNSRREREVTGEGSEEVKSPKKESDSSGTRGNARLPCRRKIITVLTRYTGLLFWN